MVAGPGRGRECERATRELSQYPALLDVCQDLESSAWLRERCQVLAKCTALAADLRTDF